MPAAGGRYVLPHNHLRRRELHAHSCIVARPLTRRDGEKSESKLGRGAPTMGDALPGW